VLRSLLLVLVVLVAVGPSSAQEAVYLSSTSNAQGYVKLSGRILDYTGSGLNIELAGGTIRNCPAEQVLRVETQYGRPHQEADRQYGQGDFSSALALYGQARSGESRAWVRRRITAQMVWCHQALDQWGPAGEEFLVLVRSDPRTIHFSCIPLAWLPVEPSPALEQSARQWLTREDLPVAVLLGASHLLPTNSGPAALARLKQLASSDDRRVAPLALAQTWRMAAVTADAEQLRGWDRAIEQMPESLRGGPYYVLGLGWAHRQQWQSAALAWLRIPILYPQQRSLGLRALPEAARALEQSGQPKQAATLYAELARKYPGTAAAKEARQRLEELERGAK
jgi:hypothetical protein